MNAKKLFYALIVLIVVAACSSDDVVPVDNGPRLKSIFVGESGYTLSGLYKVDADTVIKDCGMTYKEVFVQYNYTNDSCVRPKRHCEAVLKILGGQVRADSLAFSPDSSTATAEVTFYDKDEIAKGKGHADFVLFVDGPTTNLPYPERVVYNITIDGVAHRYSIYTYMPQTFLNGNGVSL